MSCCECHTSQYSSMSACWRAVALLTSFHCSIQLSYIATDSCYLVSSSNKQVHLALQIPLVPNVAITKTVNATSVLIGSTVSYTINVTNTGDGAALQAVLTDTLPAGLEFLGVLPQGVILSRVVAPGHDKQGYLPSIALPACWHPQYSSHSCVMFAGAGTQSVAHHNRSCWSTVNDLSSCQSLHTLYLLTCCSCCIKWCSSVQAPVLRTVSSLKAHRLPCLHVDQLLLLQVSIYVDIIHGHPTCWAVLAVHSCLAYGSSCRLQHKPFQAHVEASHCWMSSLSATQAPQGPTLSQLEQ